MLQAQARPTFLSLFCGCGGLDFGFVAAGFHCLAAFDCDIFSVITHNRNLGNKAAVADLSQPDVLPLAEVSPDLIVAGPPCQGFSTIGRRDYSDSRNDLLLIPAKLAAKYRPRAILIENVLGALAGSHADYWQRLRESLENSGFTTLTLTISASAVGLPQVRRRVLLFGVRGVAALPSFAQPSKLPVAIRSTLPVQDGVPNHLPKFLAPNSRAALIAKRVGPGQKLCNVRAGDSAVHTWDIPEVFGAVTEEERNILNTILRLRRRDRRRSWGDADPVSIERLQTTIPGSASSLSSLIAKGYLRDKGDKMIDLSHTFNGKYKRTHPDMPANCVLTKFCDSSYFLHPYEDRGFTVREAARLQGFPDSYIFYGPEREQARQVGNAVPPPVAQYVASWIKSVLLEAL